MQTPRVSHPAPPPLVYHLLICHRLQPSWPHGANAGQGAAGRPNLSLLHGSHHPPTIVDGTLVCSVAAWAFFSLGWGDERWQLRLAEAETRVAWRRKHFFSVLMGITASSRPYTITADTYQWGPKPAVTGLPALVSMNAQPSLNFILMVILFI